MLYNALKIFHIISATIFIISIVACILIWFRSKDPAHTAERIQKLTILVFFPFAMLQLATGFTMISLQHYEWSEIWILGSVIGFIVVLVSWISFLYLLLTPHKSPLTLRRTQALLLILCIIAVLSMIFFMVNKIV